MLLVLQTQHSTSDFTARPPEEKLFPLCALSSYEFVTQVTVEWKINKIKGKSLAFRQKQKTRKSNKNL